jgi:5'-nucleotidase / UDP-sugar diphosphatase
MESYMKLLTILTILVLSSVSLFSQADTLTVLYVNDSHSNLAPVGPRDHNLVATYGGIARIASFIGAAKMKESNVLALHGGDFSIGDLFYNKYFGVAELQILNSIGLDAAAIGNHEFDLTSATLLQALQASFTPSTGFPFVSANLNLDALPDLKAYIQPYTIKQVGNIKVGIFGLLTPETNAISQPAPAFIDSDYIGTASKMKDLLLAQGCNVIICISHLGILGDKEVAHHVSGINLIVGAHDHIIINPAVQIFNGGKPTYIVQANAFYLDAGVIKLIINNNNVKLLSNVVVPITKRTVPEEPTIKAMVDAMITDIEATWGIPFYTQKVAEAREDFSELAEDLTKYGKHDTHIGNLVTDAFRWKENTNIALDVCGSTAQPIYKGPIVPADLYRVVSYGFNTDNGLGFRIATFNITGADLMMGLEIGVSQVELSDELLPQVSGMAYKYDPKLPPFQRIFDVEINGKELNPTKVYTATANEFLVLMMQSFGVNFTNVDVKTGLSEFQVLNEYAAHLKTLVPKEEGRVRANHNPKGHRCPKDDCGGITLNQNYPNPFNPTTTIGYSISTPSRVVISIYNILGQRVAELVNEEKIAGDYKVQWNASNFPSGIYVYKLEAGNYTQVKRLLLLK